MNARLLSLAIVAAMALSIVTPVFAVQPDEVLSDPALETRARNLSRELRCMVCQNQSIDDSDAPLARDLRLLVRERLKAGSTDQQVLDFLVARYGDFVLLNPRLTSHSVLLWGIPFGILAAGAAVLLVGARKRRAVPADAADVSSGHLSAGEENRLTALLQTPDDARASRP